MNSTPSLVEIGLVDAVGRHHLLSVSEGETLMRAARESDVAGIEGECGGCMTCGTCHVFFEGPQSATLPPPDTDEQAMLDVLLNARPSSRLSCQIRVNSLLAGAVFTVPVTKG